MAKKNKRPFLRLMCTVCKNKNYTTERNPDNTTEKLNLKKYCRFCRKVQEHKEVKI